MEAADENPFIAVVAKKCRNIRKKLTNIQKYVTSNKPLNDEQKQLVDSKPSLEKALSELDNIKSQLEEVSAEHLITRISKTENDIKEAFAGSQKSEVVETEKDKEVIEMNESSKSAVLTQTSGVSVEDGVLDLLRLLQVYSRLSTSNQVLPPALDYFGKALLGLTSIQTFSSTLVSSHRSALAYIQETESGSDEIISGVTYSSLRVLVNQLSSDLNNSSREIIVEKVPDQDLKEETDEKKIKEVELTFQSPLDEELVFSSPEINTQIELATSTIAIDVNEATPNEVKVKNNRQKHPKKTLDENGQPLPTKKSKQQKNKPQSGVAQVELTDTEVVVDSQISQPTKPPRTKKNIPKKQPNTTVVETEKATDGQEASEKQDASEVQASRRPKASRVKRTSVETGDVNNEGEKEVKTTEDGGVAQTELVSKKNKRVKNRALPEGESVDQNREENAVEKGVESQIKPKTEKRKYQPRSPSHYQQQRLEIEGEAIVSNASNSFSVPVVGNTTSEVPETISGTVNQDDEGWKPSRVPRKQYQTQTNGQNDVKKNFIPRRTNGENGQNGIRKVQNGNNNQSRGPREQNRDNSNSNSGSSVGETNQNVPPKNVKNESTGVSPSSVSKSSASGEGKPQSAPQSASRQQVSRVPRPVNNASSAPRQNPSSTQSTVQK